MSRTERRSSVSIYDYPEHLNPFNENDATAAQTQIREGKSTKEGKHKFWTFGRSRKRSSNSFSIKSTWNGLFGKRKDSSASDAREKRSTITTVSTTYKREPCDRRPPVASPRVSKDQQEFDEALGTLARRRKYTFDNASRYSSSLTVNGDPARLYDGSPQETTTSIIGDLSPKPPARRFGQVSPRATDKIPPLNFEDKTPKENGSVSTNEKDESMPVPPLRRFGNRSSQRLNPTGLDIEEDPSRSADVTLRDENENVPDDYVFKRCSKDTVRQSNLSINSCVSVGSTMSSYGRKKRRAPQPPRPKEQLEHPEKDQVKQVPQATDIELKIVEPIDIAEVTENIDEMTKKSHELDNVLIHQPQDKAEESAISEHGSMITDNEISVQTADHDSIEAAENEVVQTETIQNNINVSEKIEDNAVKDVDENIEVEYKRTSQEKLEILKDVDEINTPEELEVTLRKKNSSDSLSRSDSFSVKEEIEKIERQIKALETKSISKDSGDGDVEDQAVNGRLSIQANRRSFFQDMVENSSSKSGIKIEFKELPREQNDIHVVRLTDPPVPTVTPREHVKIIELHISEPIKQKPEIVDEVNPIPKPRRHNSVSLHNAESSGVCEEETTPALSDKRGKSF